MKLPSLKEVLLSAPSKHPVQELCDEVDRQLDEHIERIRDHAFRAVGNRTAYELEEEKLETIDVLSYYKDLIERARKGGTTKMKEIIRMSKNCTFEIMATINPDNTEMVDIRFRQGQKERRFEEFLSNAETQFRMDLKTAFHPDKRKIKLSMLMETDTFTPLCVLHEIGHEHQAHPNMFSSQERAEAEQFRSINKTNKALLKKYHGLQIHSGNEYYPEWYLQKFYRDRAAKEIDAWQFAYRTFHSVQNEGFDVLASFDKHDIHRFIEANLWSYQNSYDLNLYLAGGKKVLDRSENVFQWNRKKAMSA
ncbi:MAG: hypothetical protein Q7R81_02930 [Candidatus Peregrinibacteria bacterium]|nr:hypothetical protein [Candidatus Peregrinibacteria bacterium]